MAGGSFVNLKALPDGVYLITFAGGDDEQHRLNPTTMAAIHAALDQVEKDPNAAALVTTNEGKFYSNGLDLRFAQKKSGNLTILVDLIHELLNRVLTFPVPTFAAVCGHAAAGGCMLALAHDYRVMRSDRGYIFMNEVEIDLHMTPGMISLLRCKLPPSSFHKALLSGHKFSGLEAKQGGFVYEIFPSAALTLAEAVKKATEQAKKKYNRSVYKAIKLEMFRTEVRDFVSGGHGPPAGVVITNVRSKL